LVLGGAYCLCISVSDGLDVEVGALGVLRLKPGKYVYVGSALNGLEARVRRHIKTSNGVFKALHWHIDYLLKEPKVAISSVLVKATSERIECELAGRVMQHGSPVRGFGCSDCRCVSHLFKVEDCHFLHDEGLELWSPHI
jgi:Uri superfamily endonuclease